MKDLVAEARKRIDAISPTDANNEMQSGQIILNARRAATLESDGAIEKTIHLPRGLVEAQANPETDNSNGASTTKRHGGGRVHRPFASGARRCSPPTACGGWGI